MKPLSAKILSLSLLLLFLPAAAGAAQATATVSATVVSPADVASVDFSRVLACGATGGGTTGEADQQQPSPRVALTQEDGTPTISVDYN